MGFIDIFVSFLKLKDISILGQNIEIFLYFFPIKKKIGAQATLTLKFRSSLRFGLKNNMHHVFNIYLSKLPLIPRLRGSWCLVDAKQRVGILGRKQVPVPSTWGNSLAREILETGFC